MTTTLHVFRFAASLGIAALWFASPSPVRADIPARIALKDQSGVVEVLLTGRRRDTLHARLPDAATGSLTFEAADIKRIAVQLPEEDMRRAEAAAAIGRGADALRLMRAAVRPVVAYLDLPIDGAVEPALRYAAIARGEKLWSEAISVYSAVQGNPDERIRREGIGWLAYCHMKNMQPDEAAAWIAAYDDEDPRAPGFTAVTLAAAMLHAHRGEDEAALDMAARAAALARIDDPLYPEAMFLSADAYRRMADKPFDPGEAEAVVLRRGGEAEVAMPAMSPEEFSAVATNQFNRLGELFAASPFAGPAAEAVKKIEESLTKEAEAAGAEPAKGEQP